MARVLVVVLGVQALACISPKGDKRDASIVDARSSGNRNDSAGVEHLDSLAAIDLPPTGNCEPFTNLGCSAAQKCTALQQSDGTLALGCGAVGSKGEGQACTQTMVRAGAITVQVDDDCAAGLACFSIQAGTPASCHRMCKSDGSQVCSDTEICSLVAPGLASVEFCRATASCSPVDQTGCSPTQACYWSSTGALCATTGSAKVGELCVNANDCVPGTTCLALSPSRCVAFCSITGVPGCSSGSTCAAISSSAAAANVGYCK